MNIRLVSGAEAWRLLAEPDFHTSWNRLASSCPWATVFQKPAFVKIWYDCYREQYTPMILVGEQDDDIVGLWFLATSRADERLTPAGAHQAEYHGWLSTVDENSLFIDAALRTLSATSAAKRLTLIFLAPGMPLDWVKTSREYSVRLRPHQRGLLKLSQEGLVNNSLKKKSNKSRLARLRREGNVELVQLHTRAELEPVIETIALHCDLRQGAVNDSTPFRSDAHKREFHLRLVNEPGLVHAVVLKVGEEVAACHIGAIDCDTVLLGLITHSPFLAKHSPGKIMLLLLEKMLTEQGFHRFDLTPGGEYKDRFASEWDEVQVADIFFDRKLEIAYRLRQHFVRTAKKWMRSMPAALTLAKTTRARIRRLLSRGFLRTARGLGQRALRTMWRDDEYLFYRFAQGDAAPPAPLPESFAVDDIRHLLAFQSPLMQGRDYREFLSACLLRLEEGNHVVTCLVDGELAHYSWLSPPTSSIGSEMGHKVDLPEAGVVLWDDFTAPRFRRRGLQRMSLKIRIDLARAQGMAPYVGVAARNTPSRKNIEQVGFTVWRRGFLRTRWGRTRTWVAGEQSRQEGEGSATE